ncbi:putative oxidoreductase [Durotheca rogersii]|uniref:putative oxidoreductase n=1 Tax=Durotheca rogersii TaxID=419775 RepID=UPI002220F0D4|nr:putative oxidoreductase [Durotheca rogersii]KAI5861492.1 putative oxidoreductase [Durotheca rogersii]
MPHKEEETVEFTPDLYPPFPTDVPTVELETISLSKLLAGDAAEQDRVFKACAGRGFFYLALAGNETGDALLRGSEEIARVGERVFKLPLEEKMQHRMGKTLFGYKYAGSSVADRTGARDTAEFFNVSKNDMIVPEDRMTRAWPSPILDARPAFASYVRSAHAIGMTLLTIIAEHLGIDPAELTGRHRIEELSGDHIRITRGPPRETDEMPEIQTPSHTDFGTVTVLMNWLGGLQVWSESSRRAQLSDGQPDQPGEWLWVRPQRGSAIINLGDAAVKFTDGAVCSGRHRVIPSPGSQGRWPRYSLVYFVRPEDECLMRRLDQKGVAATDKHEAGDGLTAKEWIYQQALALGNKLDN